MIYEELKEEASKLGYRLIKKQKYISLAKCKTCGKKPVEWYMTKGMAYECDCGKRAECASKRVARMEWNRLAEGGDRT